MNNRENDPDAFDQMPSGLKEMLDTAANLGEIECAIRRIFDGKTVVSFELLEPTLQILVWLKAQTDHIASPANLEASPFKNPLDALMTLTVYLQLWAKWKRHEMTSPPPGAPEDWATLGMSDGEDEVSD